MKHRETASDIERVDVSSAFSTPLLEHQTHGADVSLMRVRVGIFGHEISNVVNARHFKELEILGAYPVLQP